MQPGLQAGRCLERELRVAQGLGKAGKGLPSTPGHETVILTPSSHGD